MVIKRIRDNDIMASLMAYTPMLIARQLIPKTLSLKIKEKIPIPWIK